MFAAKPTSLTILQKCIKELLMRGWLEPVEPGGQGKLAATEKGLLFLQKYGEIQEVLFAKGRHKAKASNPRIQLVMVQSR